MLSDGNGIRTHSHLVRKRTLNQLAKLAIFTKCLDVCLLSKWLWVRIPPQSLNSDFNSLKNHNPRNPHRIAYVPSGISFRKKLINYD